MHSRWPRRGLYAITPDEPDTLRLLARTEPLLRKGTALLQYRNKTASAELRVEQARSLLLLCRSYGVPLIINDDWRLAAAIGADGVHLGEDDSDLADVRVWLGDDAILGASCYDELPRAHRAVAAGASYIAFGAFYPSISKPNARHATPQLLRDAAVLNVPQVAIGGITPENAGPLVTAGADLLAVITGVYDAADPVAATQAYLSYFEKEKSA